MIHSGSRSYFSLLRFPVRFRVICALLDGATAQMIAEDPEIRAECERCGIKLTARMLREIKQKNPEYSQIAERRIKMRMSLENDRLTTELLRENDALDILSDQVKVSLMRLVQECTAANPEDSKEVERLVRSAVNLSNTVKDRKLAAMETTCRELKKQIVSIKRKYEEETAGLRLAVRQKDEQIAKLREIAACPDSSDIVQELDRSVGIGGKGEVRDHGISALPDPVDPGRIPDQAL